MGGEVAFRNPDPVPWLLGNIFAAGELDPEATVRKSRTAQRQGALEVARTLDHYNLDAVISAGYRVNNRQATHFLSWPPRPSGSPYSKASRSTTSGSSR